MTWSLITAGSALLLVGVGGRLGWRRLRFWLALTRAAAREELRRMGEPEVPHAQIFQTSLRDLSDNVSRERGTAPAEIEQLRLNHPPRQSTTLVG